MTTDEPGNPVYNLGLAVTIRELVQLSTRLLVWNVCDEPRRKAINLTISPRVKLKSVDIAGDSFAKEVVVDARGETIVWIAPQTTASPSQATVKISVAAEGQATTEVKGFLRVM